MNRSARILPSLRPGRLAVALVAGLLAACGSDAPTKDGKTGVDAPVAAALVKVGAGAADGANVATGTVRLRRETPLAFVSDGRIRLVAVREGDVVQAGQVLAALDTTAIDAAAVSAGADASRARAELARQQQLFARGWIAKARVESAEAAASAAGAGLSAAQFNQRFARISAPAAGVILARLAEPGQTLAAGTPVVLLGEFASGFVLRVPLSAADVAALRPGQGATVRFSDTALPPMAASVIEIAGRADARTGTFQVEFALPAVAGLRSGLIGQVSIPQGGAGVLRIPATALFSARADEGFVWRHDPKTGRVNARLVALGGITDTGVEIRSGLVPGDAIVRSGVDRFVEGQKIAPVVDPQGKARGT